jgi:hypothetical protein
LCGATTSWISKAGKSVTPLIFNEVEYFSTSEISKEAIFAKNENGIKIQFPINIQ